MVNQIYPPELQLNKAYTSNTEALFLDFHLSISFGLVSSKIYNNTYKFPFLGGDVPCQPSYGVYISQLKRFARVCSYVEDFMLVINASLQNFSNRVIGIISLERSFSKIYHRHYDSTSKFNVLLKFFYIKAYRNQNLMMTKYTNSKRVLVALIFLVNFEK